MNDLPDRRSFCLYLIWVGWGASNKRWACWSSCCSFAFLPSGIWDLSSPESASEVAQSCPTLCDRMDCSPPGSSVHGFLQARIPEWVAISFSRGSSQPSRHLIKYTFPSSAFLSHACALKGRVSRIAREFLIQVPWSSFSHQRRAGRCLLVSTF